MTAGTERPRAAAQQVDAPDKVRAGSKPRPLQVIHVLGRQSRKGTTLIGSEGTRHRVALDGELLRVPACHGACKARVAPLRRVTPRAARPGGGRRRATPTPSRVLPDLRKEQSTPLLRERGPRGKALDGSDYNLEHFAATDRLLWAPSALTPPPAANATDNPHGLSG